jgi:hypothetical protein
MHPGLDVAPIDPDSLYLVQPESHSTPSVYEHLFGCAPVLGDLDMLRPGASAHGPEELTPMTSVADTTASASMAALSEQCSLASESQAGSGLLSGFSAQASGPANGQGTTSQVILSRAAPREAVSDVPQLVWLVGL